MKFHYNEYYFVTCTTALYLYFMVVTGLHGVTSHKISQKQRSWVKGFGHEDEQQVPLTCR